MTCRKKFKPMSKPGGLHAPGQGWAMPADGPIGIRHKGGVTLIQASVRNLGTCRPDAKGEIQAEGYRLGTHDASGALSHGLRVGAAVYRALAQGTRANA